MVVSDTILKKLRNIVSAEWLNENLNNPDLIVLDGSIEQSARGMQSGDYECTIPFARRFDIQKSFSDLSSPYPNTIPEPKDFESECRVLGINKNSKIIVFDDRGIYSSPRVWWLFNVMGHKEIAVLDGGLPNWINKGFQTIKDHVETSENGNFRANYRGEFVVDINGVKNNIIEMKFSILDARSEGRFSGREEEPRKHLKSGNIPNSINLHYQDVLRKGSFKTTTELREIFNDKCSGQKEIVFSCGSGLTACIVMLASHIGYVDSKKLYDGSWTEWAELNELKCATE